MRQMLLFWPCFPSCYAGEKGCQCLHNRPQVIDLQPEFIPLASTKINEIQAFVFFSCLLLNRNPMDKFSMLNLVY